MTSLSAEASRLGGAFWRSASLKMFHTLISVEDTLDYLRFKASTEVLEVVAVTKRVETEYKKYI